MIYLDNAATTSTKPDDVIIAINNYLKNGTANASRSTHEKSIEASRTVYDTRLLLANMFGINDEQRIVFTSNATHSINIALKGILKNGDNVLITGISHNAIVRPLQKLKESGINIITADCNSDGRIDIAKYKKILTENKIRLTVLTHASNVNGIIHPIQELSSIAKNSNSLILLDCAQTAALIKIDINKLNIDLLSITGHKSLYATQGIGALILNDNFDYNILNTLIEGGTGSKSEETIQPNIIPDKYEAGTLNGIGIASLNASIKWINNYGIDNLLSHEKCLRAKLYEGIVGLKNIAIQSTDNHDDYVGILSITMNDKEIDYVGYMLESKYKILTRIGLHCAPLTHSYLGTFPKGSIRFSFSIFNTLEEICFVIDAIKEIAKP